VAVAAHGRPLAGEGGTGAGLPAAFWDYVFTTSVIVVLVGTLTALAALASFRHQPQQRPGVRRRTVRALATLLLVAALLTLVGRHLDLRHLLHHRHATGTGPAPTGTVVTSRSGRSPVTRHVEFRWDELAVVLGLLLALAVLAAGMRRRLPPPPRRGRAPELLSAALDESLDDLRSDPDLRSAIVAAYARMEAALAAAGLPRRPAEAPLEYLERALLELDTSAGAIRRLTELFEWAKFSPHEPEPSMRDDAVDALAAVRDELRALQPLGA
jgi:hypothetical protein